MVLDTSEGPTTFRGTVASFIGDNLGSQLVGGFKEGGRALRPCRVCMATSEDIQQKVYMTSIIHVPYMSCDSCSI